MPASCQLKKNALMGCGRPATGACQYCGRAFCERHGALLEDGQDIAGERRGICYFTIRCAANAAAYCD